MSQPNSRPPGDSMEEREAALKQDGYLIGIAVVCLLNGMHFSPWIDAFIIPIAILASTFWISSQLLVFYLSSLILAVSTVMIAGIPAALFERATGRTKSDPRSLQIWLVCAFVLSFPAILRLFNLG